TPQSAARRKPRRLRAVLLAGWALALSWSLLFGTAPAAAQGKTEATAKALQKKAMEDDYVATEFGKAQTKLEQAISHCGTAKCNAGLRARLRRDLGIVLIGGAIDRDRGINAFVDAIKLDPSVAIDPDYRTKDLDGAFAEARKRAGGGVARTKSGGRAPTGGGT